MTETSEPIQTLTTWGERELLSLLAAEVPVGGLILEIGTLYGGVTSILAKSAPTASVYSIDDYSWTPDGVPNSPEQVYGSLAKLGVDNVELIQGDSREICKTWDKRINFLFIDGGHSFEFVYSDLYKFGGFAEVIALHDYKNPVWVTIEKAVETFTVKNRVWHIDTIVDQLVVLRKAKE
jgi:precorrin-6B methylase 2